MKINTEVVEKIFIVTCEGSRLDASFAQIFFDSMQSFIQKGHMDIVLDLSSVEFVDSTGLGAIVRSLKEIDGRGLLVLCGVNEMVLSLLKMTHLDDIFIQAADRSEAFKRLGEEQKKRIIPKEPVAEKEVIVEPKSTGFDEALLASLQMEGSEPIEQIESDEKRQYRRIINKQIMNEDIIVHCTNSGTGKRTTAIVLDISPGGLLLVSPSKLSVGDEFIMEGRIGRNFKFREHTVIRNCRDGKYGFEFIKPSRKTTSFLHQLTGSVMLSKAQLNTSVR